MVTDARLISAACAARKAAYAPYSGFRVGAAIADCDGEIYTGCNVENSAYGECMCAERVALFGAVARGARSFQAIAVAGGGDVGIAGGSPPCGSCRQVLSELCDGEMRVLVVTSDSGEYREYTLGELLPDAFSASDLKSDKGV